MKGICDNQQNHGVPHEKSKWCVNWRESAQSSMCEHGTAPVAPLTAEQFWINEKYSGILKGREVFEFAEAYAHAVRQAQEKLCTHDAMCPVCCRPCVVDEEIRPFKSSGHSLERVTFEQWYGNRPANRKEVSWEAWRAAAHAVRQEAERREQELMQLLEYCRSIVADGVTSIKKAMQGREWLTEGRGPYEWDDDRWHKEFAAAAKEILDALEPLAKEAADWSNCPKIDKEVAEARINLKAKVASLTAERDALSKKLEICEEAHNMRAERAEAALREARDKVNKLIVEIAVYANQIDNRDKAVQGPWIKAKFLPQVAAMFPVRGEDVTP